MYCVSIAPVCRGTCISFVVSCQRTKLCMVWWAFGLSILTFFFQLPCFHSRIISISRAKHSHQQATNYHNVGKSASPGIWINHAQQTDSYRLPGPDQTHVASPGTRDHQDRGRRALLVLSSVHDRCIHAVVDVNFHVTIVVFPLRNSFFFINTLSFLLC